MGTGVRSAVVTAITLLSCSAVSEATTFTRTMKVGAVHDGVTGAFISDDPAFVNGALYQPGRWGFRIDVYSQIAGLPPDEIYGNESFSLQLGGGLRRATRDQGDMTRGWTANEPFQGYFNRVGTPIPTFQYNLDAGSNDDDLDGVLVQLNRTALGLTYDASRQPIPDPRLTFAVDEPVMVGSFFVVRLGTAGSMVTLTRGQYSTYNVTTGKFGDVVEVPDTSPTGELLAPRLLLYVPEPTGPVISATGVVGAMAGRRRRVTVGR